MQLSCPGTLLEARGQAERQRGTARLRASLSLEAEGPDADQALDQLQRWQDHDLHQCLGLPGRI
ncbi:MAG: hypothetical protein ACKO0M_05775, partial [Cyanobium sp.]